MKCSKYKKEMAVITNSIMGKFNETFDNIRKKKGEFDKKKLHSKDARLVSSGLNYSYIELCKLQGELNELLCKLNEISDKR